MAKFLSSSAHGKYFEIRSKLSSLRLNVKEGLTAPGTPVIMWTDHTGDNQVWYEDPLTGTIRSLQSHFCLDLDGRWNEYCAEYDLQWLVVYSVVFWFSIFSQLDVCTWVGGTAYFSDHASSSWTIDPLTNCNVYLITHSRLDLWWHQRGGGSALYVLTKPDAVNWNPGGWRTQSEVHVPSKLPTNRALYCTIIEGWGSIFHEFPGDGLSYTS